MSHSRYIVSRATARYKAHMAIDLACETVILRPRDQVARYMFDPANDRAWTKAVVESRALTDGPLRAGSRVERVVKFLGRTFSYLYEVTAAEDGRFVEMRVDKPFPMHVRYELEDAAGGTLARIRTSGDPSGFFRLAAPLMSGMVRRNITRDLAMLKLALEKGD